MQAHINKTFLALSFVLFFTSCEDPLTLPAKVNFEFELITHDYGEYQKTGTSVHKSQGNLKIDQGTLMFESLEFDGRREEGKDYYFISNFSELVIVNLSTGQSNKFLSFDIPQGVYNLIEITLNIRGDNEISLVLEGILKKEMPFEEDILVRFEYPISERIRIKAEPAGNVGKIVLKKDVLSTATIIIDASVIFRFVNMHMLVNADTSIYNGGEAIIINQDNNNDIFNLMATQIEKSFSVVFK